MKPHDFNRLLRMYSIGFALSLLLSVGSYLVATSGLVGSAYAAMAIILILAGVQLAVQLYCFLHLRFKGRSFGRTVTFAFTGLMAFVILLGSIWIMNNLDYRMGMSGEAMNEYMKEQNKKGF